MSKMLAALAAAAQDAPAGGAATAEVIGASAAALILTTLLFVFGGGHRSGRVRTLGRLGAFASRVSGLPGWAAVPAAVATGALLCAVFGLYWDVSLHIDNGRDAGPLANPSHYFILLGLFGIFTAGWLAIVMPEEQPGPAALRIAAGWQAPVSGVLLLGGASFALLGFPLDDVWHRLFGQDVTLWGPTHLMMLGGAALTLVGILGILTEGRLASPGSSEPRPPWVPSFLTGRAMRTIRYVMACGGLLVALSIFQGEFDFGVPQFRLLFQPLLIAIAAAMALVAARVIGGPGAALGAALFFILVRGVLALLVAPVLGESTPHFPLYLAEALMVEGVALALGTRRTYRFGIVAGALVGSAGVLAEWGWSRVWMPIPWPGHLVGEAIALSLPAAVAAGVLGAFLGGAIRLRPLAARPRAWAPPAAGAAVIAALFAYLLPTTTLDAGATVTLDGSGAEPRATVRIDPPGAADDADWLSTIAWQGRERLRVDPLERVGEGVYRTAPLPVDGTWKTAIRLHRGDVLAGVPVYLPEDRAIPAAEVPALPRFERAFVEDRRLLQRERKEDVPGWLWGLAGSVVLAVTAALLALIGWGLIRIARAGAHEASRREGAQPVASVPVRRSPSPRLGA